MKRFNDCRRGDYADYNSKRYRSQPPARRVFYAGFYVGTFNPVHENHANVIKHALGILDYLIIIPNQVNEYEHCDVTTSTRCLLLEHRMCQSDMICYANRWEVRMPPSDIILSWEGLNTFTDVIWREIKSMTNLPIKMYQIKGEDSFGNPSTQKALSNLDITLRLKRTFLIYPRLGTPFVTIPQHLKKNVEIVQNYKESMEISSTAIRNKLNKGENPPVEWIHPEVYERYRTHVTIRDRKIIAARKQVFKMHHKKDHQSGIVVFIGAPCSGKTTLVNELSLRLEALKLSYGDIYSTGLRRDIDGWPIGGSATKEQWSWYEESLREIVKECLLPTDRNLVLVDGPNGEKLRDFESLLISRKIQLVINLHADAETLYQRMKMRGRHSDKTKRIDNYLKRDVFRQRIFFYYNVITIDATKSIEEMIEELKPHLPTQYTKTKETCEIDYAIALCTNRRPFRPFEMPRTPSYDPTSPSYDPTNTSDNTSVSSPLPYSPIGTNITEEEYVPTSPSYDPTNSSPLPYSPIGTNITEEE